MGNPTEDENPPQDIPDGNEPSPKTDEPEMPPINYKGETYTKYKISLDNKRDLPHLN